MYLIDDHNSGESYAIVETEEKSKWLVIRKRADKATGHSPAVADAPTMPEAFTALGQLLERSIH